MRIGWLKARSCLKLKERDKLPKARTKAQRDKEIRA
jgi:hypothetical protein